MQKIFRRTFNRRMWNYSRYKLEIKKSRYINMASNLLSLTDKDNCKE